MFETVFRSEDLPVQDRFEGWRECLSRAHAPMEIRSAHAADFRAHLRHLELGPVTVWPTTFQPMTFQRTGKLIRQSDPEVFHVSLLLRGTAGLTRGTEEASLSSYDLHTNDSGRPWEIRTGEQGPISSVGLEVPRAVLPLPQDRVARVVGRPLSGREGVGALLAGLLARLAADPGPYRPGDGPRIGLALADLMAALFAQVLDAEAALPPESRQRTLALRVQSFVLQRLHDADLTPRDIAAAHHISV
ncbi:AraC family transcriptional regulator, partial [Streptomyces sp. B1866]|uniref:AraC-like ligand-binding domain-containing protein n=1 Tax=Streptomyces sp. B1866 TaxID=3075431 RepID=UPI0028910BCC